VKFKRGQLAQYHKGPRRRAVPCIVLGWEHGGTPQLCPVTGSRAKTIWYKVYIIEGQITTYFRENILYPINPQGGS